MWELLVGAALAVTSVSLQPGRPATALGAAGLAGIVLAVVFYDSSIPFPGLTALLPCAAAALIIASGSSGNPVSRVLSIAPVRQIGLISYSLYLIHWPLFSFAHLYFNEALSLAIRFIIVALSFLLAYLSWRFIETPFRAASVPRFAVFGAATAAMVCLCLAGFSFSESGGFPQRVDDKVLRVEEAGWDLEKYCRNVSIPGLSGVAACELGAEKNGSYDFVVWGDSHARHFAPAINTLAKERKLTGVLFWNGGCHPFIDDSHTSRNCRIFNSAVARWAANRSFKLAILAGRWNIQRKYLRRYAVQKSPSENTGGLAKTLAFFIDKGIEVAVLDEIPLFKQNPNLCIARGKFYGRSTEGCSIQTAAQFLSWHRDLDNYFGFLKKHYRFSIASAAGALCDKEFCRARDGDRLLMADDNHLTEAGALYVMPFLKIPLLTDEGKNTAAIAETASSEKSMPAVATPLKPL